MNLFVLVRRRRPNASVARCDPVPAVRLADEDAWVGKKDPVRAARLRTALGALPGSGTAGCAQKEIPGNGARPWPVFRPVKGKTGSPATIGLVRIVARIPALSEAIAGTAAPCIGTARAEASGSRCPAGAIRGRDRFPARGWVPDGRGGRRPWRLVRAFREGRLAAAAGRRVLRRSRAPGAAQRRPISASARASSGGRVSSEPRPCGRSGGASSGER